MRRLDAAEDGGAPVRFVMTDQLPIRPTGLSA
jgi:hypothetical protein